MRKIMIGFVYLFCMYDISIAKEYKKGVTLESKDEISCSSSNYIEFAMDGVSRYSGREYGAASLSGWLQNADCNNITEGMDLKVVKTIPFKQSYADKTQAVLVKLPTGMTTWIAR